MKLNHINLYSHDTEADRAMFERYFGLRTLVVRGSKMAIMRDDDGLVLIVNPFSSKLNGFAYPESFDILHIGFIQTSREAVDALHARLTADNLRRRVTRTLHGPFTSVPKAAISSRLRPRLQSGRKRLGMARDPLEGRRAEPRRGGGVAVAP